MARRDDREYRPYLSEEQRRQPGAPPGNYVANHAVRTLTAAGDWLLAAGAIATAPVGVRSMIVDEPAVDKAPVTLPPHVLALKKRNECTLQSRQAIERNTRKVVMFEMVVRVEKRDVPEPVPLHQGAPLRGIGGVDIVVLSETIQRKRDREYKKDGDDARAKRGIKAEEIPEREDSREV